MKEMGNTEYRLPALRRGEELREFALPFMQACQTLPTGISNQDQILSRKQQILNILGGSQKDWQNWKWQLKNRIKGSLLLSEILGLTELEQKKIDRVSKRYRWAISPYYLSLIDSNYLESPIFRQAVPDLLELATGGELDPMHEALTSPAPCVTRRYPDRLIINVTNQCAMYCRHCQRRRNIGEVDSQSCLDDLAEAIQYIASHDEIRDVLITGGDALLLNDRTLNWLLQELHQIPHLEIKRIGTRVPVTLPQRITPELCNVLRRYPPIFINTQFNHPLEITPEAKEACDRLVEAGAVLGNQAVLLRGINDDPHIMKKLNQMLLKIRVRPYYIFHAKNVQGTLHFQTSVEAGMQIMESLRGHTSGLAVPTYIVNAPGGFGKIPLMPGYILQSQAGTLKLRTWEGKQVEINTDAER
ncbi:MAG TPA: glutamate 2,3-aminomutase [Syntrophomonadaceae bacterium]|nr:glutamate 2,3-aminomutase [Syntrophomonadaceae bacterium]